MLACSLWLVASSLIFLASFLFTSADEDNEHDDDDDDVPHDAFNGWPMGIFQLLKRGENFDGLPYVNELPKNYSRPHYTQIPMANPNLDFSNANART